MSTETLPLSGDELLLGFARLPYERQLTFLRYGLEIFAAGNTPDGMVVNRMVEEMAQMDQAWAKRERKTSTRKARPRPAG